jgi:hypothetical protein
MGNFVVANNQIRMGALTAGAPQLAPRDATQMAALPLGARIKLDPWSNKIEILKTKALGQLSAREKMQFEVTPVFPYLTRQASATAAPATTAPKVAAATGTAQ